MATKKLKYVFGADLSELERGWKRIDYKMKKLEVKARRLGQDLSKHITAPILAIGGASVKASINFESAFAGVRKTVNATEAEFKKLEKGIRDMSKHIPSSAAAIAEVAESAGQLGIATENILSFSRVMIDLGEASNLTSTEAASSLAQFANITQMSQKKFDRLGSAIVALGNNLATTEANIVAMGQRLAGAGKQIGLSEAEIMSFAGALASVGIEAQAGGTAFSKLMIDMQLAVQTGSAKLKEYASVANMSASRFKTAFQEDAAGAIIKFIEGLSAAEKRGTTAIKILDDMGIKEVRLRDALLRAAGASDVFSRSLDIGTKAWEENTALAKEAGQRYATAESRLKIMRNRLTDVAITIGDRVVPHLVFAAEKVAVLAESFGNLSLETQKNTVKWAAYAAAAGPALLVTSNLIKAFRNLGGVLVSVFTGSYTGPIAIIATLTAAMIKLQKEADKLTKTVQTQGEAFIEAEAKASAYRRAIAGNDWQMYGTYSGSAIADEKDYAVARGALALKKQEERLQRKIYSVSSTTKDTAEKTAEEIASDIMAKAEDVWRELETGTQKAAKKARNIYQESLNTLNARYVPSSSAPSEWLKKELSAQKGFNEDYWSGQAKYYESMSAAWKKAQENIIANKNAVETLDFTSSLWLDRFSSGIADAIVNMRSLGDALRDIGKMIASAVIQKTIGGWLGGLFGMHDGGVVGVDHSFFRPIPKMHSGGIVGSDEQLTILQKGEIVLPKEAGPVGANITININAVDAQSFSQALAQNKATVNAIVIKDILSNGQVRRALQGAV